MKRDALLQGKNSTFNKNNVQNPNLCQTIQRVKAHLTSVCSTLDTDVVIDIARM